jgi:hypothetical protein
MGDYQWPDPSSQRAFHTILHCALRVARAARMRSRYLALMGGAISAGTTTLASGAVLEIASGHALSGELPWRMVRA